MISSCGPISIRGVRTQAVRGKGVCAVSHNCSSFLSSLETVAFHICALEQFLHIPGQKDTPLLPHCRLVCSLCFSKAGVEEKKLA